MKNFLRHNVNIKCIVILNLYKNFRMLHRYHLSVLVSGLLPTAESKKKLRGYLTHAKTPAHMG